MGGGDHQSQGQYVVFWASGGGLGHLTRALAIARYLKSPYRIYAYGYVEVGRKEAPDHVYRICRGCIEDIARLRPRVIVSDTTPYGGKRELAEIEAYHILLDRGCIVQPPTFGLDGVIDVNEPRVLIRQPEEWSLEKGYEILGDDKPVLAYHAGIYHRKEQELVFKEARRVAEKLGKRLVTITPWTYYPVCELFPAAGAIVCAVGYNSHSETQAWGGPTYYVPLERECDDQFARLETHPRRFGGARLAAEVIDACGS
jgi:predicted glycosyltransferase